MPADKAVVQDEAIRYCLLVMKHSTELKPNYHAVAAEAGLSNANTAYVTPSTSSKEAKLI